MKARPVMFVAVLFALAVSLAPLGSAEAFHLHHRMSVDAFEWGFSAREITIPAGAWVQLTLNNTGQFPHDITFEAPGTWGASERITSGRSTAMDLYVTQPGTYIFYCSVPGTTRTHREQGMEGRLVVTP
ncbi:MAG: cupredoxin domain-containing protein [Chloroflexi bacterium]|nr:cupredoxin domain-containing protein [Chloroflexota bacterium]